MKTKLLSLLLAVMFIGGICIDAAFSAPKKKPYTVTDRQVELRKKVEAGVKSNELTAKEADKLISDLESIASAIEKSKSKNGGKLSYKDEGKAEKRLNKVSLTLTKYNLSKRVTAH